MAIPGRNGSFRSGQEQGFGVLLGDYQEFERGLARGAGALLPTAHGVGADVREGGEERMAGIKGQADAANFLWRDLPGASGNARDAPTALGGGVKRRPGRLEGAVAGELGRRLEAGATRRGATKRGATRRGATRRGARVGLLPRAN